MGKPTICIGKNKAADQLHGNREADHCLCFCYTNSTIPLLLKSEISSFWPASMTVQAGLCWTCSKTTLLVFPRGGSFMYVLIGYSEIIFSLCTPGPLYNTVHYNTVLDITLIIIGQCWTPIRLVLLYVYTFYSRYNTDWIANTEIGWDHSNSIIKRLRCSSFYTGRVIYVQDRSQSEDS